MSPRSCSGGPKSSPRGPKTAPRAARSAPRAPQGSQKGLKKGSCFRLGLPKASGSPPGGILEPFWSDFRPSGKHFGDNFGLIFETISLAFSRSSSCSVLPAPAPRFATFFLKLLGLSACIFFKALQSSGRKARRETASKHAKRSQLKPPGEAAQRPSKGINNRIGLPFGSSRCSCRSCGAAPRGAGALALPVLAALAARAFLAVLAAPAVNALPVLR